MEERILENIDTSWEPILSEYCKSEAFEQLMTYVQTERAKYDIFPVQEDVFNAFKMTPFDQIKVVILGQDPYHGLGQAHGLAFSVQEGVKLPPSLKNIYKEIESSTAKQMPSSGDLSHWAKQGVLLLNDVLTVRSGEAGSHQKKGWEAFSEFVIKKVSQECENVVFMLWGSHAQKKAKWLNQAKHHILKAPHPSPLSAYRGFFGCNHFEEANNYLRQHQKSEIIW